MGCANSLILMELHRLDILAQKRIVIYEPAQKIANDRTFCFWLEPEQLQVMQLDKLVSHQWFAVKVNDLPAQALKDKAYFYLRADALYAHVKELLQHYDVQWKAQAIEEYPSQLATWVFDSRPPIFEQPSAQYIQLDQSFYGWVVQTEKPIFDPGVFTMMDFSIPQRETQFLYVLPFATNSALIEPTRFGIARISENEATEIITSFLAERQTAFQILEKEQGCIPMCSAAFQKEKLPPNWIRTGAGSGQLKASTGYSFVRSLADAQQIVGSIQKKSTKIARRGSAARFAFYDRLLLQILGQKPHLGKRIFTQLFKRNKANVVLDFLDERTTVSQELRLMSTLPIQPFLLAALKDFVFQLIAGIKRVNLALLMSIIFLFFKYFKIQTVGHGLLFVGLFAVGLPHGALDHLPKFPFLSFRFWLFIGHYLFLGCLLLLLWFVLPQLALISFLTYTAWHFGQADFEHWQRKAGFFSFLWGGLILTLILLGHYKETLIILHQMKIGLIINGTLDVQFIGEIGSVLALVLLILLRKNHFVFNLLQTVLLVCIGFFLPLIQAFGCYFIFQHSLHGWKHLRNNLALSDFQMWKQALPFTLGAILLFVVFTNVSKEPSWGQFFIFLSALSFPHVWYMHKSYNKH